MATQGEKSAQTEAEAVRALYRLAEALARSETPVVRDLAIQILGHAKLLVAEVLPEEFTHVRLSAQRASE